MQILIPHPSQCGRIRRKRTRRARLGQGNGQPHNIVGFDKPTIEACMELADQHQNSISPWLAPHWGGRLYSWSGGLFTWTAKTSQSRRTRRNRSRLPLDDSAKDVQEKVFRRQIQLSKDLTCLVVHTRDALEDTMPSSRVKGLSSRWIMHSSQEV